MSQPNSATRITSLTKGMQTMYYPDPLPEWPKPATYRVVPLIGELIHYTDPSQFDYIKAKINQGNNNDCNVRFDPDDPSGTTIRWYWAYYLPLNWFLLDGRESAPGDTVVRMINPATPWTDEQLRLMVPERYPDEPQPEPETPPSEPTEPPTGE